MTESFDLFQVLYGRVKRWLLSKTTSKNIHGRKQRMFSVTDDIEERTTVPKMTLWIYVDWKLGF